MRVDDLRVRRVRRKKNKPVPLDHPEHTYSSFPQATAGKARSIQDEVYHVTWVSEMPSVNCFFPGDSSRDLFIPKRWRSVNLSKRSRFHHPKKVTLNHLVFAFCLHPYWIHPCFRNSSIQKHPKFRSTNEPRPCGLLVSKTSKRETHQTNKKNRGNFSICSHPSQKMSESPVRALREFRWGAYGVIGCRSRKRPFAIVTISGSHTRSLQRMTQGSVDF